MARKLLEVPADKFSPEVLRKVKTLAAHWGVEQREVIWLAILEFVERHPIEDLARMPNPFEDEPDG